LTVNKDRPQYSRQKLVNLYGDPKKNGGITFQDPKWDQMTARLALVPTTAVLVLGAYDKSIRHKQLTLIDLAKTIEDTLLTRGYLMLVDNHTRTTLASEGISHMYVIYGIRDSGEGSSELLVMDPARNETHISVGRFYNHMIVLFASRERQSRNYVGW
jgi:hypothetical protein